ncbi:MAG: hypothetical protein ACKVOR_05625 [Flavobacteriales bacterium]
MNRKTEILEKITKAGFPKSEVAVSVDEFFDGNDDEGSIGANLYPEQPSLKTFSNTFKSMLASDRVENIFIRIADAEDTNWFYTDTVYVVADATMDEVTEMLKGLQPTEIYSDWMYGKPVNISDVTADKKIYSVWWD